MISDFRIDDSFPVKTGSCPTGMVYPSFNSQYPSYHRFVVFSALKNLNFRFYPQNRKLLKSDRSGLKRKLIIDFLMKFVNKGHMRSS